MKFLKLLIVFAGGLIFLTSCNLEKEIDLKLPEYEGQLIVECYLEPGKPFNLLLTESTGFFEPFSTDVDQFLNQILVNDAQSVEIEHGGQTYTLQQGIFFDFETKKLYNYQNPELVPADYDQDFKLRITTAKGKTITAQTRILPVVPIDSVVVKWNDSDTLAFVLTYLTDDPAQDDYYRRMIHQSSLDSTALQDFATSDRLVENGVLLFGTAPDFAVGDTIINTIFHIDRAYYEFFGSVQNAIIAGTSPFGSPGKLIGNVEGDAGAVGIFTGLSYDRVVTIIQK
ncbi:MAG: DUF4249 domain-containing protein [Lewinellaceae bacterium]|nr:DUF4249 domain-containing protein [Lewinellaceae bacterium]